MSAVIKKHFSKTAKIAGVVLFVILMFVNVQITTSPITNGDINLFGLKFSLFTLSAYAYGDNTCDKWIVDINDGEYIYCEFTGGNCCGVVVVNG